MGKPDYITTSFVYPPIPIRTFDWQAVRGDYDLGARVGHGPTELAAIADLIEQEEMDSDAEEPIYNADSGEWLAPNAYPYIFDTRAEALSAMAALRGGTETERT